MKNQGPNLNTLPRHLSFPLLIHKRTMWHSPRPSVNLTIKTLDQQHLSWGLLVNVKPPMSLTWPDAVRLPFTIRIDQLHRHEILIGHRIRFRDAERVLQDRFDGSPYIDDLVTAFEKLRSFGWQMMEYALRTGGVGLVDVYTLDGAT